DRNLGHALEFLTTRVGQQHKESEVVRQEHVFKGVLQGTVNKQFNELVQKAMGEGIIDGDSKAIGKSVHKFGLPYVMDALQNIRQAAEEPQGKGLNNPDGSGLSERARQVVEKCKELEQTIQQEISRLGHSSGEFGIERRGAEVHLSLA